MKKEWILGFLSLLGAAFLFSSAGIFDRTLSLEVDAKLQLFIRGVLAIVLQFFILRLFRVPFARIAKSDVKFFVQQGLLQGLAIIFFIWAIVSLDIGFTLLVFYSGVLVSGFLYGFFWFRDKIDISEFIGFVMCMSGLVYMGFASMHNIEFWGLIFAFASGSCFSLTYAISKNVADKYNAIFISFIQSIGVFLVGVIFVLTSLENISFVVSMYSWVVFFIYSVVGISASLLTILGYKFVETQKASVILLMEIIFGIIIARLVYSEVPNFQTVVGGVIIMTGLVVANIGSTIFGQTKQLVGRK